MGRLTGSGRTLRGVVKQVSERLAEHGFIDQHDIDLIREDVRFVLPSELAVIAPAGGKP